MGRRVWTVWLLLYYLMHFCRHSNYNLPLAFTLHHWFLAMDARWVCHSPLAVPPMSSLQIPGDNDSSLPFPWPAPQGNINQYEMSFPCFNYKFKIHVLLWYFLFVNVILVQNDIMLKTEIKKPICLSYSCLFWDL